ncbi:MAG: 3-oxoacyl-ACP synthase, partial [Rhodothermaceae bacterium]|nr:3-oxoacyl-ACP synthase [Rhodothermaceae bacterium]
AFPEDRIFVNVHNYGNTSAASVPIALTEAFEQGRVKKGDIVAMIAFGAGLTWAGAVMMM